MKKYYFFKEVAVHRHLKKGETYKRVRFEGITNPVLEVTCSPETAKQLGRHLTEAQFMAYLHKPSVAAEYDHDYVFIVRGWDSMAWLKEQAQAMGISVEQRAENNLAFAVRCSPDTAAKLKTHNISVLKGFEYLKIQAQRYLDGAAMAENEWQRDERIWVLFRDGSKVSCQPPVTYEQYWEARIAHNGTVEAYSVHNLPEGYEYRAPTSLGWTKGDDSPYSWGQ